MLKKVLITSLLVSLLCIGSEKKYAIDPLPYQSKEQRIVELGDSSFKVKSHVIKTPKHLGKLDVLFDGKDYIVHPKGKEPVVVENSHFKKGGLEGYGAWAVKEAIKKGSSISVDKFPNGQYTLEIKARIRGTGPYLAWIGYWGTWALAGAIGYKVASDAEKGADRVITALTVAGKSTHIYKEVSKINRQSMKATTPFMEEQKQLKEEHQRAAEQLNDKTPRSFTPESNKVAPGTIIHTSFSNEKKDPMAGQFAPGGYNAKVTNQGVEYVPQSSNEVPYSFGSAEHRALFVNATVDFSCDVADKVGNPVVEAVGNTIKSATDLTNETGKCLHKISENLGVDHYIDGAAEAIEQGGAFGLSDRQMNRVADVVIKAPEIIAGGTTLYGIINSVALFMGGLGASVPGPF